VRFGLATALGLALVGCGGSAPPPAASGLTLGTTAADETGFYPLSGDQPLVPGAQGGFHVWLKYRVAGMAPGRVHVQRNARRVSDGALVLTTEGTQEIGTPSEAGYWELPQPVPSFMCPTPIGIQVMDEQIQFEVTVTAPNLSLTSTAVATPRCPQGDQAQFCAKICAG
jgi:hypothetical protein